MNRAVHVTRTAIRCTRAISTSPAQHARDTSRYNMVINFIPQQEVWMIERFGKFNRMAEAGINLVVPLLEEIAYRQSLKEEAIEVPSQSGITSDNVTLSIDGVLYVKVVDPYKTSYGIEDYMFAIKQLAQTTMRSEIGKLPLDMIFQEREALNKLIVASINDAAESWGVLCLRYEIKNIDIPASVQHAMQMQVEAERKKRAHILDSEGQKTSTINIAEGEKQSAILQSEGKMREVVNEAEGRAQALELQATARAQALQKIAAAINNENGDKAAGFAIAEQYMTAFTKLAQDGTTLILPSDVNNPANMIAQAMAVYEKVHVANSSASPSPASPSPAATPTAATPTAATPTAATPTAAPSSAAPSSGKPTPPPYRTTSSTHSPKNVELLQHSPTANMILENKVKLPKHFS